MDEQLIARLETNLTIINAQLNNRPNDEFYFKPKAQSWSMIEVLRHLVDEEIYDFRARLFSVVEHPGQPLPPFDPIKALAAKNLVDEEYNDLLDQFMDERLKSVAMLRALDNQSWGRTYHHPDQGPLSARFFLKNWVAHDYIHIQQMNRLAYSYLQKNSETNLDYAGNFRMG